MGLREEGGGARIAKPRKETIRDCRDWSVVEYSPVKGDAGGGLKNIEDDAEEHEHRLESWNKVRILDIVKV